MSQVKTSQHVPSLDHQLRDRRQRAGRSAEHCTTATTATATVEARGLPTREAAHRRNKKLLADLQVTEARLRSLAHYGPACAILEAEQARLVKSQQTTTEPS